MKKRMFLFLLVGLLFAFLSCSPFMEIQGNEVSSAANTRVISPTVPGFKVVGYMPSWSGSVNDIQYDKLTHINYAFILPTASGGLSSIDNASKLSSLVSLSHANGVKVAIAVGGWNGGNDSAFETFAANASTRTVFVNNIMNFVNQYNLDGVDIDWEYPDPSGSSAQNYAALMNELSIALHSEGKFLSAAVVALGTEGAGVLAEVFDYVDFLNLMAYDGGNDAAHSPYSYAVESFNYWTGRGLPASKAIVGLPFYARPSWESYKAIVARDSQAPYKDESNGAYYNGIDTIKAKTQFALNQAGGVMMWELSQDTAGDTSLLKAIADTITIGGGNLIPVVQITSPVNNDSFDIGSSVTINANASDNDGSVTQVEFFNGGSSVGIDTLSPYSLTLNNLNEGSYTLTAVATDNEGATGSSNSVLIHLGSNICVLPIWEAGKVYNTGDQVHHNDRHWQAGWWTQGREPGTTGQWGVWSDIGACIGDTNDSPSVNITAPSNGASVSEGSVVTISANASDTDGTIVSVSFYSNFQLLQTDNSSPYSYNWANVNAGNYDLTAIATDNDGAATTSAVISIAVNTTGNISPTVDITSPADGASFTEGAAVAINVNADDPDGSIANVEFFNGSTSLSVDSSEPYTAVINNIAAGSYAITVVATDNLGATDSDSVNFTVTPAGGSDEWQSNTYYALGDIVTYSGSSWKCAYAHTSNSAWYPGASGLWFWELQ